ncbi:MAG: outer membrane protein assembly factor [Paraglaciecola sp.]|uniref:outer membrane protein assembly factor n=1 Tax=Paraglaciecola sp. TaxID=1920173 RepID=UPI00273D8955|nr:outer membrane protein assembly factor [Paraglaciecola sp.]MDP5030403.1 outer membrane protein assembly factor [Paraglaciecola sp.]MDP5041381.1 outer membrane protein assembly factor [Paraglaciecola sp.]MDP5131450.1 outer membrane protein assembly factor [Paraglaciecola sp.]
MKHSLAFSLLALCSACSVAEELATCATPSAEHGNEESQIQSQFVVKNLNITTNPIFDEDDEEAIALHRFANWLHINTKEDVIAERLPFTIGDTIDGNDLAEAERIIRKQAYIRDAKIKYIAGCQITDPGEIQVQTWDNWSMIPTVSFGRKGGENKFSIGLKEDNLLGLGIRTRFKYNTDEQRSGYQLTLKSATPYLMPYSTLLLDYLDNDDGNLINLEFDRPFYHARTERMYFASYLSDEKDVDIFQNGRVRNTFANQSHRYEIATGWQIDSNALHSQRIKVGLVDEESLFTPVFDKPFANELLPQDRQFQYLWLGFESLERDYRVLSDIYLIQQAEDINLGWHYEAKLGIDFANNSGQQGLAYHVEANVDKGWEVDNGLLLVSLAAQSIFNHINGDHYLLSAKAEYFKRYTELVGFYARVAADNEKNPYLDFPLSIGDETGVRGYPLQYQHGERSASATLEARLYTGYNIYKLLDVGFAGFFDIGRAWNGQEAQLNESDQILSSIGVGARLYSNRSSHRSVIHVDIVKPLTQSDSVDSWEWRLQVKQSF